MASILQLLKDRGFVAQESAANLGEYLDARPVTVYAGFDPTADSLHLGHVVPIMALAHFQRAGHRVLLIVGGATGMIGDPSGRSDERNLQTPEQINFNAQCIKKQMERFFDFHSDNAPVMLNNFDWIGSMGFIDWLRDVGKHFTIAYMLAKDSVKRRLESEQGISYTEFSYMTLQAYDFLHLFDQHGCTLQIGGNDQWGNITAGIELIHKLRQKQTFGLTLPLVTTSSGEKFGKSAGNALWLDPNRTTPWDFYQYLVRQEDQDVVRFLKLYTFLPLERIRELEESIKTAPEKREAQKALAFETTRLAHGDGVALEVQRAAEIVYHSEIKDLSDSVLGAAFASAPSTEIPRSELEAGLDLPTLLTRTKLAESKNKARQLLESGAVYVNNVRVPTDTRVGLAHLASPSFVILRSGKKNYHLLRIK